MAFIYQKNKTTTVSFRSLHEAHTNFEPIKNVHPLNEMKSITDPKLHYMQEFSSNYTTLVHLLNKRM